GREGIEWVKWMPAFWKDACDEGGFAWNDTNNTRAFLAGEISATLNGASIYIAAKRQQDKIKDERGEPMWRDIDHFAIPAGPAGIRRHPNPLPPFGTITAQNHTPPHDIRDYPGPPEQMTPDFKVQQTVLAPMLENR